VLLTARQGACNERQGDSGKQRFIAAFSWNSRYRLHDITHSKIAMSVTHARKYSTYAQTTDG